MPVAAVLKASSPQAQAEFDRKYGNKFDQVTYYSCRTVPTATAEVCGWHERFVPKKETAGDGSSSEGTRAVSGGRRVLAWSLVVGAAVFWGVFF